jgi:hypothetical protein
MSAVPVSLPRAYALAITSIERTLMQWKDVSPWLHAGTMASRLLRRLAGLVARLSGGHRRRLRLGVPEAESHPHGARAALAAAGAGRAPIGRDECRAHDAPRGRPRTAEDA